MHLPSCPNFYNFELAAGTVSFTTSYPQCTLSFSTDFLFYENKPVTLKSQ
jgi:hypothetical protein